MNLSGEVALVSGGASGIGLALARGLVSRGARVAIGDVNADSLARAAEMLKQAGIAVLPVKLDVANAASWEAAAAVITDSLGPVGILCNNAGVGTGTRDTTTLDLADWNWVVGINLTGVFLGTRTFAPGMVSRGSGHILNTASVMGLFPKPRHAAYVATKFAVVGYSESLRIELAPAGVGVTVLCPGLVTTPLRENSQKVKPSNSVGADIAAAVAALASEGRPAGIDPAEVAATAIDAVEQNRLYAITHREYDSVIEERQRRLSEGFAYAPLHEPPEDPTFLAAEFLNN